MCIFILYRAFTQKEKGGYMVKITICDDNKTFTKTMRKKIRAILDNNSIAAEIHVFDSAEQLPEALIASCAIFSVSIATA